MPVELRFEAFGDVQVHRSLLRMADASGDMRPVFNDLADDFYEIEQKQFDSQGAYASGGWRPLARSTLTFKVTHGLDPRILHATLAMRNSLTRRGAKGAHRVVGREEMTVTSALKSKKGFPYPAVHQKPIRSRLPRRRPVEFTPEDRARWVKKIQFWLLGSRAP